MGDASIKVADLEDARREIISLSGVPAPYLGYNDVVELREQLVHTNVAFANEIADLQEGISEGLRKLIDRIAKLEGKESAPSNYIEIGLIPPAVLMLQLVEMTLSSVGNIGGVFQQMNMPFDPYQFLESYVPYVDWDKFKDRAERYQGKAKAKTILGGDGAGEQGGF